MNELESFAAAVLARWREQGGAGGGPIAVSALLDQVFPYRAARRVLGIDVSEDYEAMVLRLLAEEDGWARVEPVDAADMAKATMSSKLPDLDVLQLLRAAMVTISDRVAPRQKPSTRSKPRSKWADEPAGAAAAVAPPAEPPRAQAPEAGPVLELEEDSASPPSPPAAPESPATTQETTMPTEPASGEHCWSCGEALPAGRRAKFCPYCGADQRAPACAACGGPVERQWKHCPDCGTRLWSGVDG